MSETKKNDPQDFQKYFPRFMWLLRDVTASYDEDENDQTAAFSKYLREVVLTPTGHRDCDSVVSALTTLFPQPILCNYLPYPNDDPEGTDLTDETTIDEEFREQFHRVIGGIKACLKPKFRGEQQVRVSGKDLAGLTEVLTQAINKKDTVPSLEGSWRAVVKLKLGKEAEALVASYEEEMSMELAGEEPLEEALPEADSTESSRPTLMELHDSIFTRKRAALMEKVSQMVPRSGESETENAAPSVEDNEDVKMVVARFDSDISVKEGGVVKSGVLYKFVTQNCAKSEKYCSEQWQRLEEESGINTRCAQALNNHDPEICQEVLQQLQTLKEAYNEAAIGPAREMVFTLKNKKWEEPQMSLRCIPGPPTNFDVVGKSSDAMKLQWDQPRINPEAATRYIVEFRKVGRGEWVLVARTTNQWYIVRNLKCNTKYEFRVLSLNDEAEEVKKSIEDMLYKAREERLKMGTRLGKLERAVLSVIGFLGGTAVAPLLAAVGVPAMTMESRSTAEAAAACVSIPFFATLGAPIVGGTVAYQVVKATAATGDLEDRYVPRDSSTSDAQSMCSSASNASE